MLLGGGGGDLSFTVGAAPLSPVVLNSDSTAATLLLLTGNVLRIFASQGLWSGGGKLKSIDLENYTTLAINLFIKPFKKIRRVEEFYLYRMILFHLFLALSSLNNFTLRGDMLITQFSFYSEETDPAQQ